MKPRVSPLPLILFAVTLFTSATLLFLMQPMIGKAILPRFGGTPAVWNTCMVFFQAILLAGYAYAHFLTDKLTVGRQAAIHAGLLLLPLAAFVLFPIGWTDGPDLSGSPHPALGALLLLTVLIGLPAFVVCTSAPLLQRWFADTGHPAARDPYFLYAASNLGSMVALLCYPVLVEPGLALPHQGTVWMVGYVLLAVLTLTCARLVSRLATVPALAGASGDNAPTEAITATPPPAADDAITTEPAPAKELASPDAPPPPTTWQQLRWLALAFVPSSLVLGLTTHFTTDIAAVPLLWLAPLTLYLLSFIIVFSKTTAVVHSALIEAMPIVVLILVFLSISETTVWIGWLFMIHLAVLLAVATVCHGELARDRPAPRYLTRFYLCMSIGGVLGGLFNALVAPLVFNDVSEYYLVLVLACLCLPVVEAQTKSAATRWFEFAMATVIAVATLWVITQYVNDWRRNEADFGRFQHVLAVPAVKLPLVRWAVLLGLLALAIGYIVRGGRERFLDRALDVVLPLCLWVLAVRLIQFSPLHPMPLAWLHDMFAIDHTRLVSIITGTLLVALAYVHAGQSLRFALAVAVLILAGIDPPDAEAVIFKDRNFFGVSKVEVVQTEDELKRKHPIYHRLLHGTTMHGQQRLDAEPHVLGGWLTALAADGPLSTAIHVAVAPDIARDLRIQPIAYFHRHGPVGQFFGALTHATSDRRPIGVIGLGTGTLCGYVLGGQNITFYDIDPMMVAIASNPAYFTFLRDCRGTPNIIMGDGRLRLAEAPDGAYRLFIVDAFSSDAIPVHLLTREAVKLYFDKLTPDGALVVHISNRYLKLAPVLGNIAADLGLTAVNMKDDGDKWREASGSHWVVLARKPEHLGPLATAGMPADRVVEADVLLGLVGSPLLAPPINARYKEWELLGPNPKKALWTDKYSNLLSTLD